MLIPVTRPSVVQLFYTSCTQIAPLQMQLYRGFNRVVVIEASYCVQKH